MVNDEKPFLGVEVCRYFVRQMSTVRLKLWFHHLNLTNRRLSWCWCWLSYVALLIVSFLEFVRGGRMDDSNDEITFVFEPSQKPVAVPNPGPMRKRKSSENKENVGVSVTPEERIKMLDVWPDTQVIDSKKNVTNKKSK